MTCSFCDEEPDNPITPGNLTAVGFVFDTAPYLPPKEDLADCYFWESANGALLVYFYSETIRCFVKAHKGAMEGATMKPETMADIETLMRMLNE